MLVELDLRLLLCFSRKLFVVKNDSETPVFGSGSTLYTGVHYTQVNTVFLGYDIGNKQIVYSHIKSQKYRQRSLPHLLQSLFTAS